MFQSLVSLARHLFADWSRGWRRTTLTLPAPARPVESPIEYRPLERLVLTDGVSRTLFEEYTSHRAGAHGEDETGWILLGHRHEKEAIALATLPAGALAEAGVAHVRFNSTAQAVASRIVRQQDRLLGAIGVVHTHPGTLRHPSSGDYDGDKEWVGLLRGGEGVFGIGTADGKDGMNPLVAVQPKRHSQCYLGLRFTWYALAEGDRSYRPLPVRLTIGPDLARPLHDVWTTIEAHAERLDSLCRRLAKVRFEIVGDDAGPALHVVIPVDAEEAIRVVLMGTELTYCLVRKGQWLVSDSGEPQVDRGVFLMLAELTGG